jgi:hypothetical protein
MGNASNVGLIKYMIIFIKFANVLLALLKLIMELVSLALTKWHCLIIIVNVFLITFKFHLEFAKDV